MKNRTYYILLLSVFAIACTEDEQVSSNKMRSFLDETTGVYYLVNVSNDTTIITEKGTEIFIPKHTFTRSEKGAVKITIEEVYSKKEMIVNKISTLSSSGEILETGGMINFEVLPRQPFEKEVIIRIPANGINPEMKKFRGTQTAFQNSLEWEYESTLLNTSLQESILQGEYLYDQHCVQCHSRNLREVQTGPALGNVNKYRAREWLISYTKNPQGMVFDGDELANCIDILSPSVMASYEDTLSENQINSIYVFIENESALNRIDSTEVEYILGCTADTIEFLSSTGDAIEQGVDWIYYTNQDTFNLFREMKRDSGLFTDYLNYEFGLTEAGWYNVDVFLKKDNSSDSSFARINKINLSVKNDHDIKNMLAAVVYDDKNVVLAMYRQEKNRFELSYGSEGMWLPKRDPKVIVIGERSNDYFIGTMSLNIPEVLDYELELKRYDKKEMEELLESL